MDYFCTVLKYYLIDLFHFSSCYPVIQFCKSTEVALWYDCLKFSSKNF